MYEPATTSSPEDIIRKVDDMHNKQKLLELRILRLRHSRGLLIHKNYNVGHKSFRL